MRHGRPENSELAHKVQLRAGPVGRLFTRSEPQTLPKNQHADARGLAKAERERERRARKEEKLAKRRAERERRAERDSTEQKPHAK